MEKSKVYFTDMRTSYEENLQDKLRRMIDTAGMGNIDFNGKFVAIKIHFGEPGNLAYLRPNYARVLVEYIQERGGLVFLTDCNTLYVGRRRNGLEHITSAYENGYTPFSTNCHVIIADGIKGTDEALIDVDGELVQQAKIGRAIADADIIISLSHFKGHVEAGFGGAIKNIGMGSGSRAGKLDVHCDGKPGVDQDACVGCGLCAKNCAHDAISYVDGKADIDIDKCVGCCRCLGVCPTDAISSRWSNASEQLNKKMVEYTMAVVKDKPSFHVSLAIDISPGCDCEDANDMPVVGDVGMFASFDPVALDAACVAAVNAMPSEPRSVVGKKVDKGDYFTMIHPESDWKVQIAHGKKMGLGNDEYELVKI